MKDTGRYLRDIRENADVLRPFREAGASFCETDCNIQEVIQEA